jgi:hypothetical protein
MLGFAALAVVAMIAIKFIFSIFGIIVSLFMAQSQHRRSSQGDDFRQTRSVMTSSSGKAPGLTAGRCCFWLILPI